MIFDKDIGWSKVIEFVLEFLCSRMIVDGLCEMVIGGGYVFASHSNKRRCR